MTMLQIAYAEEQVECRRVLLLRHFEEHFDPMQCKGTCDNCKKQRDGQVYQQQVQAGGGWIGKGFRYVWGRA